MLDLFEIWEKRRTLPLFGKRPWLFWPFLVVVALLGGFFLVDQILQGLGQRHAGPLLRDHFWNRWPSLDILAVATSLIALTLALCSLWLTWHVSRRGQAAVSRDATTDAADLSDDRAFIQMFERRRASDPNWVLALPLAVNGRDFIDRYERLTEWNSEDLGSVEHMGVIWNGRTSVSGILVDGPYCPRDGSLLRFQVSGLDTPVEPIGSSQVVFWIGSAVLYCRRCQSQYGLGTETNRGKLESVNDARDDARLLFQERHDASQSSAAG